MFVLRCFFDKTKRESTNASRARHFVYEGVSGVTI